ncbi:restriction endonuclease subunit S [Nodularia spumigena CS-586/05]|uniref:restriction endonuclease subunit S n=1 Tax=Nodularia spumigena TaxID=70799 RepID=UPI00232D3695|nr:restriction endonuclease subunit S [Nodularia spumigena]MDB9344633.1 restriction endonuclease subunit S [Nodularia spumigena CS-588/06]MDB9369027.1 restriction endonuclease subunit S [Nodularia spumigena CS-586/05]
MGKYQGYQKYKDSGVEWLGDIPKHWELKRFKFSFYLVNNKIEAENSNLSYMGLEHIESWTGKRIEDKNASSEGIGSHFLPNDVLFGKLRPYLAKVYLSEIEGLASTEALVLRCKNNILPNFSKYYILSRDFINIVDSSTFGAKMPRASWDFIGNLFFTFPPLDEQEKIAQFLDYKTKQIDELIKKKETLIEKLDEKRTALISHAVTKGLDPSVPMKDSGIEWLGDIPNHWKRIPFRWCCYITEGQVDPTQPKFKLLPLIAPNHIESQTGKIIAKESAEDQGAISGKFFYQSGTLLYSKIRPALVKACISDEDGLCSADMYPIKTSNNLLNQFMLYQILSKNFTQLAILVSDRVAMPKVNRETLGGFPILVPPLKEQQKIAEYLDQKTTQIDQQKAKIKEAIELLKEYRTSLITNAVTGKIDVREVAIP